MKDLNSIVEEINGNKVVDTFNLYNLLGINSKGTCNDWFWRRKYDGNLVKDKDYYDFRPSINDKIIHYLTPDTAQSIAWVEEEHKKGTHSYKKLFKAYRSSNNQTDDQSEKVAEVSHRSSLTDIKSKSLDPVLEVGYNVLQEYYRTEDSSYKQMLKDFMNMMTKNQSQTTVADEGIKLP